MQSAPTCFSSAPGVGSLCECARCAFVHCLAGGSLPWKHMLGNAPTDVGFLAWCMQPWNWMPYALFDMHWDWARHRSGLQESFVVPLSIRLVSLPMYGGLAESDS